jgi:hypothetical protein
MMSKDDDGGGRINVRDIGENRENKYSMCVKEELPTGVNCKVKVVPLLN